MLNQTVLVGRITTNPELKTLNNDKKGLDITLAIPRSYKNEEGIYDTDFITCKVWNGVAENVAEYCKKGDIVGVKGRLQTRTEQDEQGNKRYIMEVIAEKVTFLSSRKEEKEEE